jgi:hypothetical protein
VSPVKYEMGSHIPENDILRSHGRDNLKSYIEQTHSVAFSPQASYTD